MKYILFVLAFVEIEKDLTLYSFQDGSNFNYLLNGLAKSLNFITSSLRKRKTLFFSSFSIARNIVIYRRKKVL